MRVFQSMGINALKWDFQTYKLEVKSLGEKQEKKGLFTQGQQGDTNVKREKKKRDLVFETLRTTAWI